MKNYILFLFWVIVFYSCSNNRYLLNDKGSERNYLVHKIEEYARKKLITKTPMLVIDGRVYRYKVELEKKLKLSRSNIKYIGVLENNIATTLYGKRGIKGVVLINTHTGDKLNDLNKLDGTGLILYDGNVVDKNDLWNINPLEVISIDIIHSQDEIAKLTSDHYQWIVVIKSKKE
ncbi:MAG: hypothetical protein RIS29_2503 [Bacteroidota bacterium]|jgi:hypothetical protein